MTQDVADHIKVLGRVPSGLFIITASDGEVNCGFLASFVQQVSFKPLLFAVACHPDRFPYSIIHKTKRFAINVISDSDKILIKTFAKGSQPGEDLFAGIAHDVVQGIPLLRDAIGSAVCNVVSEVKPGDHAVFFGEAVDGRLFDAELKPSIHVRKSALSY